MGMRWAMKRFPKNEYHVPFFDELSYIRKSCPCCGAHFWTQNQHQETCGESTPDGCAPLAFINNPPTPKRYNLQEMREAFLSFFETRGHERIAPYPVVSRWRDDLYFTHASIIDFQPYVTNGIIPPPANPLVISQPCIRFIDVDNVGPTFGRHLTIFEMGGHHAFNYPDKEVYWKDQTVRYHHDFITKKLGVRSEEVIYKEDVWSGGGNAGPDLETIVRGLELATLVFMKFKVEDGRFIEVPIRTVDTGYGIERYTWLSQGTISCFDAVYGPLLNQVLEMAGIDRVDDKLLARIAEASGLMSVEKTTDRQRIWGRVAEQVEMDLKELAALLLPIESAFAVLDHTKCLAFMLAEGVVPSNVREGYLTRLVIRRTYRLLKTLAITEKLPKIIERQIELWARDFPLLKEMQGEILEILSVERAKFEDTLMRGKALVRKISSGLKARGVSQIPPDTLVELYDSHGLPPDVVKETAEDNGVAVEVPENFYIMVAERHEQAPLQSEEEKAGEVDAEVSGLPKTEMLYYTDAYLTEFETQVLRVIPEKRVVLERTTFYPEGGGQPADYGILKFAGTKAAVVDVQKVGNIIVHTLEGPVPAEGDVVRGVIDWKRRNNLMQQHTATHVIMGAAKRVLGKHVWQCGAQKGLDHSRLDISHFQRLTPKEVQRIEMLANEVVMRRIPVKTSWLPRGTAEERYGFQLYQGGVVPGKEIRVVESTGWEVEACAGTHVKNTGELGFIKIVRTERIQDGVERIVFSAGLPALRFVQDNDQQLSNLSLILNAPREKLEKTAERLVREWKETRRREKQLIKEIALKDTQILDTQSKDAKPQRIGHVNFVT
ncbi:MAG: alanine--tRNA ligase, partial [Candidatus Bathyarchaeota archaeon]